MLISYKQNSSFIKFQTKKKLSKADMKINFCDWAIELNSKKEWIFIIFIIFVWPDIIFGWKFATKI